MEGTAIEYVGFRSEPAARTYVLRLRARTGETREVLVAIPSRAFAERQARLQDGPEICFAKVQAEVLAGATTPDRQELTAADLDAFRVAHLPKPKVTRARARPAGDPVA